MQLQYVNLTPSIPKRMDAHPYNVESLRVKGKKRVLVVLDHIPTEDLKTRKLMSGATGATIDNCCQYIDSVYSTKTVDRKDLDILFTPFNLWKTYHLAPDRQLEAEEFFAQNIRNLVSEYKPDYVMLCGPRPFQLLCPKETELAKGELLGFVGSSFNATFGTHRTRVVYNLSPNSLLGKNIASGAYLLGYFARAWLPIFGTEFRIPAVRTGSKRNFKIIKVDTVKQFDAMLRDLRKRKRVSVDTETNGLRRIMVNMLTLQLCGDGKTAYVIPFDHADAKWSAKDHEYVKDKLRQFFEHDNSNDIHVYTNAKFDMSILRTALGVRSFKNDIWDIIAGEFALDENGKNLATITGNWYYKLATISMAYGCRAYLTTSFGKQNRAMIKDVALTDDVLEYCSLDVIIPWHVVDQQMAKAAAHGYTKYCMMVRGHISDQIHSLAVLEHTGAPTDVDYLFSLSLPDSPINSLLSKTRGEFMEMPELRRAEKVLRKRGNIPSSGLFGDIKGRLFKLSSREHLQTLFFDVMGLSAPEDNFNDAPKLRPNGEPERKIGKSFQNMHKNNPVIKAFTEMSKLFKLRNAYVKSLIRMFGEDEDFRATRRLRPNYNYDKIVTGRTSADAPNLQQIPSRGAFAKYIKRLLITDVGKLLIKVDFSAHEIRGWSIISGDTKVADVFEMGAALRRRFRLVPDAYIAKRLEYEGDVHKMNASFFFGISILDVVKAIRDAVKTVVFGLIYQQGDAGLAESTGRDIEEIGDIKQQFLSRFPVGYKWFDKIKAFAKAHFYVESPIGRRRTLFSLLMSDQHIGAKPVLRKSERQSVNSPVQGLGSDFMMTAIRLMERECFQYWLDHDVYPDIQFCISVHDSVSVHVGYKWFWFATDLIERNMSRGAAELFMARHNMELTSIPEIDFEVGSAESNAESWNLDYLTMRKLVTDALVFKRDELKQRVNVDKVVDQIMEDQYDMMPLWVQKQLWANNIKIRSMGKTNPLTREERKLVAQYKSEVKGNKIKLEEICAKEEAAKAGKAA